MKSTIKDEQKASELNTEKPTKHTEDWVLKRLRSRSENEVVQLLGSIDPSQIARSGSLLSGAVERQSVVVGEHRYATTFFSFPIVIVADEPKTTRQMDLEPVIGAALGAIKRSAGLGKGKGVLLLSRPVSQATVRALNHGQMYDLSRRLFISALAGGVSYKSLVEDVEAEAAFCEVPSGCIYSGHILGVHYSRGGSTLQADAGLRHIASATAAIEQLMELHLAEIGSAVSVTVGNPQPIYKAIVDSAAMTAQCVATEVLSAVDDPFSRVELSLRPAPLNPYVSILTVAMMDEDRPDPVAIYEIELNQAEAGALTKIEANLEQALISTGNSATVRFAPPGGVLH